MIKAILLTFFLLTGTALAQPTGPGDCPADEIYSCANPFDELNCTPTTPGAISLLHCLPACTCKTGLLRNSEGKCVKPAECACELFDCSVGEKCVLEDVCVLGVCTPVARCRPG